MVGAVGGDAQQTGQLMRALPVGGAIKMPHDALVGRAQVSEHGGPFGVINRANLVPDTRPVNAAEVAPEHVVFQHAQVVGGMGHVGGDGGAVAHRLRGVGGGDLGQGLEEGCAFVEENGALYGLEGLDEQETEAGSDFRYGDLVGHGVFPHPKSVPQNEGGTFSIISCCRGWKARGRAFGAECRAARRRRGWTRASRGLRRRSGGRGFCGFRRCRVRAAA